IADSFEQRDILGLQFYGNGGLNKLKVNFNWKIVDQGDCCLERLGWLG
ncbi:29925_t:CDS:2, partial [Racocetra persica]